MYRVRDGLPAASNEMRQPAGLVARAAGRDPDPGGREKTDGRRALSVNVTTPASSDGKRSLVQLMTTDE